DAEALRGRRSASIRARRRVTIEPGAVQTLRIIDCTYGEHAAPILDILNEAIAHSTALYDYQPRTLDSMRRWFEAKDAGHFPVLGAVGDAGQLLGFASYGSFRPHAAYKYTVEHSVYVDAAQRGRGLGRALLERLISRAREQQYHVLVGAIDADNQPSIALHEALGFVPSGTLRQVGFKFGRWLDLALYQLRLETPVAPQDG
ncbi:MAG TPA: GNAT family N-acetyltransferase, partial [Polyangiaceae bacterium]|nr:GNAT family N-acetyltransferase [Polyangiaceae bacterium]